MDRKVSSIDQYLSTLKGERRVALEKLRESITAIVPEAEECISYRIPAFRLEGRIIAGFAARTSGCSYFPFSGATLSALADELAEYDQTKSSLHFDAANPLPVSLVRKLLKVRLAEIRSPRQRSRGRR